MKHRWMALFVLPLSVIALAGPLWYLKRGAGGGGFSMARSRGIAGSAPSEAEQISQGGALGNNNNEATPSLGFSCHEGGTSKICLGIKIVAFVNPASGRPTLGPSASVADIQGINSVWRQCDIGFQIDSYSTLDPKAVKLAFNIGENDDLTQIRTDFGSDSSLLVVLTGTWNRSGSLGGSTANAWTAMPGDGPYGAVLEQPVGEFSNIIAHELGHYLNLVHVGDPSNLMNPVIYNASNSLSADQCADARRTAETYWSKMIR